MQYDMLAFNEEKTVNQRQTIQNELNVDRLCPLCRKQDESQDHLFFKCDYNSTCCTIMMQRLQINADIASIGRLSIWLITGVREGSRKR